ncbi:MAG TPA: polysaccharide lyase family protein [Bryobacteraceae bacterium]|nr:polysaccharide lyase family protein [Bryobacteraceae bacterium]
MGKGYLRSIFLALLVFTVADIASAAITVDTTTVTDWKISNGVISVDWNSLSGHIFSMHLAGHPDDLIDVTNTSGGQPKGLYMDNTGLGSGTTTASFQQDGNRYVDWWITTASNSKNPFTYSQHFILTGNDSGIHVYFVVNHGPSDIAGSIGQIQFVFRINLALFTNTYSVNSGLNNLGATAVPQPDPSVTGTRDPGRQVQDATVDLHGLTLPQGFRREFYTKYDYSSYEYLHQAHGVYGSTFGAWAVLPSKESLVGGPTKQDLIFTNNIIIMECQSNHLDNGLPFPVAAGTTLNRMYGPFYFHINTFDLLHRTPASLYWDAVNSARFVNAFYDHESVLLQNGYVPSTSRGVVESLIRGAGTLKPLTSWTVLSDSQKNFQYSDVGRQYWVDNGPLGLASFLGVAPGTYRLSTYVLGQWGELRRDGVTVAAHQPTVLPLQFTPENFGSAPPIWTIGTPDRSAHEFLHGQTNVDDTDHQFFNPILALNGPSHDDREYWGNWNYWADFASTQGAVIYYATPVGSTPATNDLSKWNYVQWHRFHPGLYAGIYNPADDTTDGYKYICPSYVGDCTTTNVPDWQVHFTTTTAQQAQGQYVVMSVGLAATEASMIVSLNGHTLIWHGFGLKNADAQVRSGLAGTYQWVVFQWPTSDLNAAGADNIVNLSVNRDQGVMYDALRMEITNTSAAHESTGWNDYEYLNTSTYEPANDSLPNQ